MPDGARRDPAETAARATLGGLADLLLERLATAPAGLLAVTADEGRADAIARLVAAMDPSVAVAVLPRWDVPPFEPASPARDLSGRRLALAREIAEAPDARRIILATPDALIQKLPPADVLRGTAFDLAVGVPLDLPALEDFLRRTGWIFDERVDEPGEAAVRGQVIDLFPPAGDRPVRVEHADGRVVSIDAFDPGTQRTTGEGLDPLRLLPASEAVTSSGEERAPGLEHKLAALYPALAALTDLWPDPVVVIEHAALARADAALDQIEDAARGRASSLYLDATAWAALAARAALVVDTTTGDDAVPRFVLDRSPRRALAAFLDRELGEGRAVAVTAADRRDFSSVPLAPDRRPVAAASLEDAAGGRPGMVYGVGIDLDRGFRGRRITVISAADVLGNRARRPQRTAASAAAVLQDVDRLAVGDTVVHLDHGLGVLRGIETVEASGEPSDFLKLEYKDGVGLMVPVAEIGRIWRYGSDPDAVTLDRVDGTAWAKRRESVMAEIAGTAERLAAAARSRGEHEVPAVEPPVRDYERFVSRFAWPESADQAVAISAVLADLRTGRPMDRLVCGDVGYGKTEVALRAAAAVALSGRQVAVIAPTTVLARQHEQVFRRRFRGLGVEIGFLTRFVAPAEARRVKAGIADGSVRIAVGTHALAGKGVTFRDLALVVIDEEQRFGAAQKAKFRALGEDPHRLSLSATPIPRSLQAALAGLTDVSVIATPPAPRRPVRTVVGPADSVALRDALLRERARGGQSFVVCPRIEDIEPLRAELERLVPDLTVRVAHGKLPEADLDSALVDFADGEGDVLLATNVIESGLDIPRANTLIVRHADLFGLAQLHQLRGRVGRGRRRGVAHFTWEAGSEPSEAALKRLQTLAANDGLGAGFAISARDLDARGAGDLLGEEQAGHVKLIGAGLYRHLLARALRVARGEPADDAPPAEVSLGTAGSIPQDYVPEADVRIDIHRRLAAVDSPAAAEALADEIEDRFGPPPAPVAGLLAAARLGALARPLGISRIDGGPAGLAFTFPDPERAAAAAELLEDEGAAAKEARLVVPLVTEAPEDRAAAAERVLAALADRGC